MIFLVNRNNIKKYLTKQFETKTPQHIYIRKMTSSRHGKLILLQNISIAAATNSLNIMSYQQID